MKSFYKILVLFQNAIVKPPFDENGDPQPIVIVGPNGSGKTIFLSYIVDALAEFAKKAFTDIVPSDGFKHTLFQNHSSKGNKKRTTF